MDDPHAVARLLIAAPQIVGELEVGGPLLLGLGRDAQQVRGFVDDDDRAILEADLHSRGQRRFRRGETVRPDGHDIARLQGVVELRDRAVIDRDGLEFQPSAHLLALLVGPGGEEKREQFRGLIHGA